MFFDNRRVSTVGPKLAASSSPLEVSTRESISELELTECQDLPIYDDNGNVHEEHDTNHGYTVLTCMNGHKSVENYVAACSCGWTSKNEEGSRESFSRSDENFWK